MLYYMHDNLHGVSSAAILNAGRTAAVRFVYAADTVWDSQLASAPSYHRGAAVSSYSGGRRAALVFILAYVCSSIDFCPVFRYTERKEAAALAAECKGLSLKLRFKLFIWWQYRRHSLRYAKGEI